MSVNFCIWSEDLNQTSFTIQLNQSLVPQWYFWRFTAVTEHSSIWKQEPEDPHFVDIPKPVLYNVVNHFQHNPVTFTFLCCSVSLLEECPPDYLSTDWDRRTTAGWTRQRSPPTERRCCWGTPPGATPTTPTTTPWPHRWCPTKVARPNLQRVSRSTSL